SARPASRVSTLGASPPGATTVRSPASRNRSGPSGTASAASPARAGGPAPAGTRARARRPPLGPTPLAPGAPEEGGHVQDRPNGRLQLVRAPGGRVRPHHRPPP